MIPLGAQPILALQWTVVDTWTLTVGVLCAAACALPGALLVLRRLSMMGDAISHTVLAGIAAAFLITASRDPLTMFLGALIVGVLTAVLVEWVQKLGRTEAGASMGVVFTILFAVGVVLITQAHQVDLDVDCVLYGAIDITYLDRVEVMGMLVPRAAVINGAMLLVNVFLVTVLFKEFRVAAFDPALANSVGVPAWLMHYLLMIMVAATAVAAFETVGSVLVIAMIIVPGATAFLLTGRLWLMLVLSVVIGVASAVLGYAMELTLPQALGFPGASLSGMMATAAGVLFAVTWVASPRSGLIAMTTRRFGVAVDVLREDVLGLLYRLDELRDGPQTVDRAGLREAMGVGPLQLTVALRGLRQQRLVTRGDRGYQLTDTGRGRAQRLIRTHRLWETYLVDKLGIDPARVHATAERLEHVTDEQMRTHLGDTAPDRDPHNKPIPPDAD